MPLSDTGRVVAAMVSYYYLCRCVFGGKRLRLSFTRLAANSQPSSKFVALSVLRSHELWPVSREI
jgi:hypothetical protein